MQFINSGDAVMEENGSVKLVPNRITTEEEFMN